MGYVDNKLKMSYTDNIVNPHIAFESSEFISSLKHIKLFESQCFQQIKTFIL